MVLHCINPGHTVAVRFNPAVRYFELSPSLLGQAGFWGGDATHRLLYWTGGGGQLAMGEGEPLDAAHYSNDAARCCELKP